METVAVVLMVLGLIGVGSALVVLVRLRGQLERLGEQVDRVARRVEALPPDLSRVFGNRDRHIISRNSQDLWIGVSRDLLITTL
jgi:hypothetical protein